jgi:hypothetical protein
MSIRGCAVRTDEEIERDDRTWRAAALANFPYEHWQVPGAVAFPTWRRLKSQGRGVPIVLGDNEDFDQVLRYMQEMSKEQVLVRAKANLDAAAKLRHPDDLIAEIERQLGAPLEMPPTGAWPDEEASEEQEDDFIPIALDENLAPLPMVNIALIPARNAAEVPAYLNYGGWNTCPFPAYQVAALRSWRDRYGAELVSIGSSIELLTARPPTSRDEALALAREQQAFCPDIHWDTKWTLSEIAAMRMAVRWWSFWWN